MSELSAISTAGLVKPQLPSDAGPLPDLRWIDIDALYVDLRYQREIGKHSRSNISRIAAGFDWSFFAPVIVAPAADSNDFYLIIDGQHRTTAAKLIGEKQVPCSVVSAGLAKQAAAFAAVNGTITRVHTLQMHRSAVAARDPRALALEQIAIEGKTRILASPTPANAMKPGDTMAIASLRGCAERFGREQLVRTLLIINSGSRAYRGLINRDMLEGICFALPTHCTRDQAIAAFETINLNVVEEEARREMAVLKGRLSNHIAESLEKRIKIGAARPSLPTVSSPSAPRPAPSFPIAVARPAKLETPAPHTIKITTRAQGLSEFARIIDRRQSGGVVSMGEPGPGRSALAQREAEQAKKKGRK